MLADIKKLKNLTVINEVNHLIEIECKKHNVNTILKKLKEESLFLFDQLLDITAVDHPSREFRFDLIYIIQTLKKNKKIILKTSLKENEAIQSITSIHKAANWYERECYDLFGIIFEDHPDLRRIMTDYDFSGHPLRKDFPLTGHTQVRYDDLQKKVVYEPVKLQQEYRNFDYSSPWKGDEINIDVNSDLKIKENETD